MKILFADDSRVILELVSFNLRKQGHDVETVRDGDELIERIKSGEVYDVIVTDNNMPKMNGTDALRILRADGQLKDLPVIVYSGDASVKSIVEGLGGMFINKFLSSGDLFVILDKIAKKKGGENG